MLPNAKFSPKLTVSKDFLRQNPRASSFPASASFS
jgi:hypothetical protein